MSCDIKRCTHELEAIATSASSPAHDPWGLLMAESDWLVERQMLEELHVQQANILCKLCKESLSEPR